jgi:hypothetical protein
MTGLWKRLKRDETGFVISSELVLVSTVGVLGMLVGIEAVSSSVNNGLNDLASAFGAVNQSYNYRSIAKIGHARISGAGFNDGGDYCDCTPIVQTDVAGEPHAATATVAVTAAPAAVVQEQVIRERVIDEVLVQPAPVKVAPKACCEDEIIEEHIIRRRVRPDCSTAPLIQVEPLPQTDPKPIAEPQRKPEKPEPKPKKNGS